MAAQLPLNQAFIVSIWVEAVLYGFLAALTLASVYVNVSLRQHQNAHSRIMFAVGLVMWGIATAHIGVNCYRLVQGYVIHAGEPGGAEAWLGLLSSWSHIAKDVLLATQEILGDAVAVYRTWILWNQDWRILCPLTILLIADAVSGYSVCATYTQVTGVNIFDKKLESWIPAFYALSFAQSLLTTGLMAYRIWSSDRRSLKYRLNKQGLMPYLRILVESAALQLILELIALIFYAASMNAQYVVTEMLTPAVGITFNAITIRIALRSSEAFMNMKSSSRPRASEFAGPAQTIGGTTIPMRPITISIRQDMETDGRSDGGDERDQK
ncbi:hypothetical protein PsYK624_134010 [Phanerochaete sordida]|uniref:Uncharacterized protein n=1 Tax=Phanerochaete sordida TaxID=48140 RepID=A0A9P3GJS3_9APHY|nr:hypothetical protein PsYK624_134010 [Phanerochaete sordida]